MPRSNLVRVLVYLRNRTTKFRRWAVKNEQRHRYAMRKFTHRAGKLNISPKANPGENLL